MKCLKDFLPKVTAPSQCEDLKDFISIFLYILPIIAGDRIALKELAIDFCRQQYEDKCYYSEARYTPWEVIGQQGTQFSLTYDEVMQTLLAGFEEGCKKYGIKLRSILSVLCEWEGAEDPRCIKTLELLEKYKYDPIKNPCGCVGIDIAGNEAHRFEENIIFDKTFQTAKKMGFHRTVHAGEASGADSVRYAIMNMCAERIGHGYRSVEDLEVLEMVKQRNEYIKDNGKEMKDLSMIHFECCPTSSVCTNAVKEYKRFDDKWETHPIRRFIKEGIHFSINTDDPMVFQLSFHLFLLLYDTVLYIFIYKRTDMAEEIDVCRNKLEMSWKEIGQCDINGAEAAFIDDPKEKQEVIDIVTKRVNLWIDKQRKLEQQRLQIEQERNGKFKTTVFGVTTVISSYLLYRGISRI